MKACPATVAQALVPFPQYCNAINGDNENIGSSTYNALQIKAEKRMSNGFWVLGDYTWSRTMTNSESSQPTGLGYYNVISPYERQRDKALSHMDIPQTFTLTFVYDLPFGSGRRWLNGAGGLLDRLVKGWQASTIFRDQAGTPLYFTSSVCNVPGQIAAYCLPGVLPGANPFAQSTSSFDPGKGPLLNAAAFEPVSDFNFNLGEGSRVSNYHAFGFHNEDFGMSKTTRITERVGIELRFEFFNVWNWHTFTIGANSGYGLPFDNAVGSPTFGDWNGSVSAPRNIQLGAKITF